MTRIDGSHPRKPAGVLRSLGQFFGHIIKSAAADTDPPPPAQSVVLRRDVEVETRSTPAGVVRVRRTITEEVTLADKSSAEPPRPV